MMRPELKKSNTSFGGKVGDESSLMQPLLDGSESLHREKQLTPNRWNKLKVLIANSQEMSLLTLGLCLSVYQEDFFTLIY